MKRNIEIQLRENFKNRVSSIINKTYKSFLVIVGIYFIGIIAIVRADVNYYDDMYRVNLGYHGWGLDSRFLSDFLCSFIHGDSYLTDISPLTQLIAVMILSITAIIMLYLFTGKLDYTFSQYAAIIPLGLSPYFLQCISYKFDSPYMAMSVFFAVMPLLFRKKNPLIYGILCFVGNIIVCLTYQASCGIFPMLVITLSLKDWSKGEKKKLIIQYLCTSIVGYMLGLVIFKFFIMTPLNTYISNEIDILQAFGHLKEYYLMVISDFKKEWLILVFILLIAFVIALIKGSIYHVPLTLTLTVCAVIVMFIVAFGPYPVLKDPLYEPRAMYGFGVLIAILAIEIASESGLYLGKTAAIVLAYAFFTFSFTYGNALYAQTEYTNYKMSMVAKDLNDLAVDFSNEPKLVQVVGETEYAPSLKNLPDDFSILYRLLPRTFGGNGYFGSYALLNNYGLKNLQMFDEDIDDDFSDMDLPVLKDTSFYTIKGDDLHILIEVKQ